VFTCSKLVIACLSGYVSAFLSLVGELCVYMAPCWAGCCHVHARGANLPAGGTVRAPVAVKSGHVFANSVRYM